MQIFGSVDPGIQEKMDDGHTNILCAKIDFAAHLCLWCVISHSLHFWTLLSSCPVVPSLLPCHYLLVLMPRLVGQRLRLLLTNREKIEFLDEIEERLMDRVAMQVASK